MLCKKPFPIPKPQNPKTPKPHEYDFLEIIIIYSFKYNGRLS